VEQNYSGRRNRMQRKKPLVAKTSLKAKSSLKAKQPLEKLPPKPKKRRKLEEKTAQQLIKVADKWFSYYIRLRDSKYDATAEDPGWYGQCISCNKYGLIARDDGDKIRFTLGWDAGHFISRGNKFLRYDEENVNLQCAMNCNRMRSGNIEKQKPALDDKYGTGTWQKLQQLAVDNPTTSLRKPELLALITEMKARVKFYLVH
jgi:hypothetical protein